MIDLTKEQLFAYVMLIFVIAFFLSIWSHRWEKKLVDNTEFEVNLEKQRLKELGNAKM